MPRLRAPTRQRVPRRPATHPERTCRLFHARPVVAPRGDGVAAHAGGGAPGRLWRGANDMGMPGVAVAGEGRPSGFRGASGSGLDPARAAPSPPTRSPSGSLWPTRTRPRMGGGGVALPAVQSLSWRLKRKGTVRCGVPKEEGTASFQGSPGDSPRLPSPPEAVLLRKRRVPSSTCRVLPSQRVTSARLFSGHPYTQHVPIAHVRGDASSFQTDLSLAGILRYCRKQARIRKERNSCGGEGAPCSEEPRKF